MPDTELSELFERLSRDVDPSPELLDEIRTGIRVAERRRRVRVAAAIVALLLAIALSLVVLTSIRTRDATAPPSSIVVLDRLTTPGSPPS